MLDIQNADDGYMEWGLTVEELCERLSAENAVHSFHNLKFDGWFFLDYLLKNGYSHTLEKNPLPGEFNTLISDMNKFFSIKIKWFNGMITELRDSTKKFPGMTVSRVAKTFDLDIAKGEIDYHAHRPVGYWPTEEELEYLDLDIRIMAKALKVTSDAGMTALTIGSDSLSEYKSLMGVKLFERTFPVLSDEMDAEIRRAYRGGWTYLDARYRGYQERPGLVFDVNSLYPAVMYNEVLPYGEPLWCDGEVLPDERHPLTVFSVTFTARIKPKHVPCIQIKGSSIFGGTEYLERIDDPVTLMVTNVDWELYNEQYDIDVLAFGGGWRFKGTVGLFKTYIDKWAKIKAESTGGQREIAKLHLNTLYGKFASNPNVTGKVPVIEDDRVRLVKGPEEFRSPVYTAMGVFITAYARAITIRAAQVSYDVFAYADTDSLHLLTETVPEGLDIHPSRMGAWKMEYRFEAAHYVRPKVYMEQMADGSYHTAWAGLPDRVSSELTFDDLVEGAEFHGKLQPRSVPGGVVLEDVRYTLKL